MNRSRNKNKNCNVLEINVLKFQLYIEINAGDLLEEVEAGKNNLKNVCDAILDCMLEGDTFIFEPAEANKLNSALTVRYYCDNLSESRKKYYAR